MSTKVECDFRHVRTIILQASNQRSNYENYNQSSSVSTDDSQTTDFETHADNGINEERTSSNLFLNSGNEELVYNNWNGDDLSASTSSYNKSNISKSFPYNKNSSLNIRIKYLDDREKMVLGHFKQTISLFKRDNFLEEQSQELSVRLIYNGQELKEGHKTLEQYGLTNNCIVHCLITQPRQHIPFPSTHQVSVNGRNSDRSDIEIGHLMFPLFGVLLTLIWYCRICYRHYFNVVTTFALIGMTIIYFIACITCFNFGNNFYAVSSHSHMHRNGSNQSNGLSFTENTRISLTSSF